MSVAGPGRPSWITGPATWTIVAASRFIASAVSSTASAAQRYRWRVVVGKRCPLSSAPTLTRGRSRIPLLAIQWLISSTPCALMKDMTILDDVDRAVIHALHIDGRAPFTKIGDVLGVSTQTVARRYRRLRAEASLRVVGLPDPQRAGQAEWMVRLTATPNTARDVALALARRADTAWVKLVSGGTEICVNVHTPAASDHSLLLRDVPRSASITTETTHQKQHHNIGGPTAWLGRANAL